MRPRKDTSEHEAGIGVASGPGSADVLAALVRALVQKLQAALDDTNEAADVLTDCVLAMCALGGQMKAMPQGPDPGEQFSEHSRQALQALQFHDRLEQRVGYVCRAMSEIADLLSDGELHGDVEHWRSLAELFRDACTSESDKAIFRRLTESGVSDGTAAPRSSPPDDDVVLF